MFDYFPAGIDVDWQAWRPDNCLMKFSGRIQNGVVVFDEAPSLPDGTEVIVVVGPELVIRRAQNRKRIELPLVPSADPGSVHLTNEMIGQILDDEDAAG